ncbi:4Fe-4S ferredoxin iron-sulfur binding domain-containing protein [Candidatus Promineifilum breve]|uniref:4Fe-4S ferredoxin iron-sulfur binding domain-containing protein n=1 Tax=Candidatus Promineifilum breve TaxID=1806508 RepID=A0A160T9F3_9CHLR|nr:FesM [Candidatus Promineifilum breve]CUS06108.1 4Fe-4S ferredoxin iron-sulfur binding domain-containing protein [Candidatus Promineifilum breve]
MIQLSDIAVSSDEPLYRPPPRRDLLRAPLLGRLLRARRGRLWLQLPFLLVALLLIYDGFSGPPLAAQNLATVGVWVHTRGFVILALLLFGNLFCMGCPFTIPRTVALRLSGGGRRWPRALRHKWLAVAAFVAFLFLYEWLDLWAGPALTAWVIIGYFLGAFVLELLFAESPFCKYICPLGTFNFVGSTVSPTQITVRDRDVCRACPGKECVNGSPRALGCGTELFPPMLRSNLDCVFCLDCARACPYDNVALAVRPPGRELVDDAWPRRWDVGFLVIVFAFAAPANAFGMVPPFYDLLAWLSAALGTANEFVLLALVFGLLFLLLPAAVSLAAARLSRALAGRDEPLRVSFSRYAPAFVPLGVAVWAAHYGFHFATGALALIPVFQTFLIDHGLTGLGAPNWRLGPILPGAWLLPLQTVIVLGGFAATLYVGQRIGRRDFGSPPQAMRALLPWLLVWLALAAAALATFNLPMEMRGTMLLGG